MINHGSANNVARAMNEVNGKCRFLPARRYASAGNSDRNVSVHLSVRHTLVLCQNEESYRHDFFTIW